MTLLSSLLRSLTPFVLPLGLLALTLGCDQADEGLPTKTITIYSRDDINAKHAIKLLKLAGEKAGVSLEINSIAKELSADELREALERNEVDVIWTATSTDLEQRFLPIRIPLYQGLLGYRICIVHSQNRDILGSIDTVDDLKRLTFGQGEGWSDTEILTAAGLTVESMKYESLFKAVDQKAIDCAARAIFEAYPEQYSQRYRFFYKLHVDTNIMIHYTNPFYFFTRKDDEELHVLLSTGLLTAVNDGSYEKAIRKNPSLRMAMSKITNHARRTFEISNPLLPGETPLDDARLWFTPY